MGSQFKSKQAGADNLRLLKPGQTDAGETTQAAVTTFEQQAIARLVEQLGFSNPEKAKAYLAAHPGILGKAALLPALDNHGDASPLH